MALHHYFLLCSLFFSTITAQIEDNPGATITNYPLCGQQCSSQVNVTNTCAYYSLPCDCSPLFRSLTAACEAVTCSPSDYNATQLLADTFCASLYANNSIPTSSVTSAIASATASALATVDGKDVTSVDSYPICAQGCLKEAGCGVGNRSCVCSSGGFAERVGVCVGRECGEGDVEVVRTLGWVLCEGVGGGGGGNGSAGAGAGASPSVGGNGTSATGTAPVVGFTGGVGRVGAGVGWGLLAVLVVVGAGLGGL